jgi:biopolymer transport protein ExbD
MALMQNRAGADHIDELSEINVTPFIDVMLVLLIIFMVAAPLSTVDIAVDLPTSNAEQQKRPDKLIFLTVKSDLGLSIENDGVDRSALRTELDKRSNSDREQRIFLRADQAVPYGEIMKIMNLLREAGYLKVALVGLEATK